MMIKDYFPDAERYFNNDCYCPNEVYDLTGVFYELYYPEDQFSPIMRIDTFLDDATVWVGISKKEFLYVVVLNEGNSDNKPAGTINEMQRLPINKSNYLTFIDILNQVDPKESHQFDLGEDTLNSLNEVLSMSDAIMID